ncbi:aminotransferase class I/II-fold pyridoxal phosphate-dependent enzyme [Sphingobacterium oryzagri]|uniref:Aminotransferase class I/II-fold pyridoxal phosphate-dependent enzyme n=1 Tax=Sphingobacterium oryzagri TaxID=3025669 RepID=A0ABY7WCE7_9SPHI|nr:aminotransferase class I/II-fold pyridoxal phosphate-dependent enzyme [Sphingobacterium sp. KACC 22765]WDF67342.1 aminotransferase class I/II-fold pyridoxal phosphate-dependent enzyme [Sphingobacterium sp. KACC 22765]
MIDKEAYPKLTFKDFENIPDINIMQRAAEFDEFLDYLADNGRLNYRLENQTGCAHELEVKGNGHVPDGKYVNFVSNDYLGFTQHPEIKKTAIQAIENYGNGAGASPAIGGHYDYHVLLEERIAAFFGRTDAILYTTGYTANSATIQALLKKEDIAILDMAVHASIYEGCSNTNVKTFLHNNMEHLEDILRKAKDTYRTKMVIIDGVYSQDGDVAKINEILTLVRRYGAYLLIDDAHGVGVHGKTGRGILENPALLAEEDIIITGVFSKTFGGLGGYVVAEPKLIRYLKFQSRQHLFSVTLPPSLTLSAVRGIELLDEEPIWMQRLWENIAYYKQGLIDMGFNVGTTASGVIPVKIGDPALTAKATTVLYQHGIYANCIMYPAVSKKDARIRMSMMATHTKAQLDQALEAFAIMDAQLGISSKSSD